MINISYETDNEKEDIVKAFLYSTKCPFENNLLNNSDCNQEGMTCEECIEMNIIWEKK